MILSRVASAPGSGCDMRLLKIMPEKLPKAVVAFAGARDHYQLPLALSEADLLQTFVTDTYWPADRQVFMRSLGKVLPASAIGARFCAGIPSRRVSVPARAFVAAAGMQIKRDLNWNAHKDASLSERARQVATRTGSAIFTYSYYAFEAFREGENRPPHRFLFQVHPHPQSIRTILRDELELTPHGQFSLRAEHELSWPDKYFQRLSQEPTLANGWVVASTYTARTLSDNGIPNEKIHVVPYGVDTSAFSKRIHAPNSDQPFRVLFIGSLIQRKGLSYLLDAVRQLKSRNVKVMLCGRGVVDSELIQTYSDLDIEVKIGLPRDELVRLVHTCDVFVLPSLIEGFAHVIVEAMACGLPVITTENTCGPDVLTEGQDGFIVPIRDARAIAEKLEWGISHRDELAAMGERAADTAALFTWERFRQGIRQAYAQMFEATETD